MQSPPVPRYLVPPRSKYSPQHLITCPTVLNANYLNQSLITDCSFYFLILDISRSYSIACMPICLLLGTFFIHPFFFAERGGWGGVGNGWGLKGGGSAVLPTSVSCLGFSRNILLRLTLSHQPSCMSCPACLIDRAPTLHRKRRHRVLKNTNFQSLIV